MFGLTIEGATVAWGARAIYGGYRDNYHVDLLWDRQQMEGDEDPKARKELANWINKKGLPQLRKQLKKLGIGQDSEEVVEIIDGPYILRASPNRSYGYLYIGAGEVQPQPKEV